MPPPATVASAPEAQRAPSLLLEARDVGMAVSTGRILHPTSLTLRSGELIALIGPSGSGKSTFVRALAGVSEPTEGAVMLGAEPIARRTTDIGYLPDGETVHARLTVREALSYTAELRLAMADLDDAPRRVDAVLDELRLTHRADTWIRDLSGGERKRAAVAVELIADPAMLLLDEPATGLDPSLERQLMTIMRGLADRGRGVLVVTHATNSLRRCDRVAVMGPGGHLRFVGTPDEVLSHYDVHDYDEVYDALEPAAGDEDLAEPAVLGARVRREHPVLDRPLSHQATVLASRYLRTFMRDRRTLTLLLLQAPIIGAAIVVVLPSNVLGNADLGAVYAIFLAFLVLTGSIWVGVTSSAREIVKERTIVAREAAAGVRLDAYLTAKAMVLLPLAAVQVLLLLGVAVALQPLNASGAAYGEMFVLCVLAAWASVGMGLAVSARARSADQASSAVPLLLIPQLLFAGAIIPNSIMPVPIQDVSYIVFARWGLAGMGNALGVPGQISDTVSSVTGYQQSFFTLPIVASGVAMLFFMFIMWVVAGSALDRRLAS